MRRPLLFALTVAAAALGVVLLGSAAGATPADPTPRPLAQPDGSTFSARLWGDEYVNGYETEAGFTVVQDARGVWTYAEPTPAGRLKPSGIRPDADGEPPAEAALAPHLRDEVAVEQAEAERESAAAESDPAPPAVGTQDVLVVLAQFSDQGLTTTVADWSNLFFGPTNSVQDYYDTASFGALDLEPATETDTTGGGAADDGIVTVTLPIAHPNSGRDFGTYNDVAGQILAAADASVDFDAYDVDNDGFLAADELHLGIVVAGTEASQSCEGNSIWAHRSSLNSPITADGVAIGDDESTGGFFTAGELQCDLAVQQATVGVWVHEFGHDLGLIDLYDVDNSSGGVDSWSVMGIHWLALPGEPIGMRPPLPDPFSRWELGWLTPTQVTTPTDDVSLSSSATTDDVVQVLDNPGGVDVGFLGGSGDGEYFLAENREQEGYDIALPGCGVLVWHIDETRFDNGDDRARRVDVEEAGGGVFQSGFADSDDPFPSELPVNTEFGPTTRPNSSLNSGLPSGVALTDFSPTCGPTQTLDVDPGGGPIAPPANDRLANAGRIRLGVAIGNIHREAVGHNVNATAQPGEPVHAGAAGRSTVWWAVRAPRAGFLNITSETTFRENIAVYTGPNITHLQRVESVVGLAPGQGGHGSPPVENVYRGLGFRAERNVRYLIAVDARVAGHTGGIRLFVDFDSARPDVRPVRQVVAPGEKPELRVQIRNTSDFDRMQVYGLDEGGTTLHFTDCPGSFVLRPGQSRTCHVRDPITGPAGRQLRGKVDIWIHWLELQWYSHIADSWFARVAG